MTSTIKQYLEAADRRPAVDVTELGYAARNAAHEVRELVRELKRLDLKFRSGNSVPVERATITADEWNRIRELVR